MRKTILLAGTPVACEFRRFRRQKCLRLTVRSDATVLVTAPKWARVAEVESFVLGQSDWVLRQVARFRATGSEVERDDKGEYLRWKERARALVHRRLRHFNALYGFAWKRIAIRRQKTMWGSCSADGNLNFNYKLALLPPDLADYVVVHELCHLKELNHSPRFWALVARAVPDHRARRESLKSVKIGTYERTETH